MTILTVLLLFAAPRWEKLPKLPDRQGFAGCFAGTSGKALLLAGGANFPGKKPWEGGKKVWYDTVFVLDSPTGKWRSVGKLPRPLAYGASVTTDAGLLCLGGTSATRHYADCFLLRWDKGKLTTRTMPSLPKPCAYHCAAKVGDIVYVSGGTVAPDSTTALKSFWSLDLSRKGAKWKELRPCPGPGRMLSVAASHNGAFFLLSGSTLSSDKDGKPARTYLRDAYAYTPAKGWKKLPSLPRPAVAAPSPAPVVAGQLLVISGDDGKNVGIRSLAKHPGFPRDVLAFADGKWKKGGESPLSRATAPIVLWRGWAVVLSGEVRPGFRSPEIWGLTIP